MGNLIKVQKLLSAVSASQIRGEVSKIFNVFPSDYFHPHQSLRDISFFTAFSSLIQSSFHLSIILRHITPIVKINLMKVGHVLCYKFFLHYIFFSKCCFALWKLIDVMKCKIFLFCFVKEKKPWHWFAMYLSASQIKSETGHWKWRAGRDKRMRQATPGW